MRALVRMPAPLFGLLLGREWYVEVGVQSGGAPLGDIFQPVVRGARAGRA
jgi:hypothetical protein